MLVLVNLDTAVERRRHMVAQLDALALRHQRVGFDGRARPAARIAAWSRERFGDISFDFDLLSGAEVGCWLSHLAAWDLLRSRPDQAACAVIEDDVVLDSRFPQAIATLACAPEYDVVYLGTSSRNISARRRVSIGDCWVHEPIGMVFNTWAYVIAREYVQRFFAIPKLRIRVPIDHFLGGNAHLAKPRIAVLCPPVVTEDPGLGAQSQIEPHTFRLDRWKIVEFARRRLLGSRAGDLYYSLFRLL